MIMEIGGGKCKSGNKGVFVYILLLLCLPLDYVYNMMTNALSNVLETDINALIM